MYQHGPVLPAAVLAREFLNVTASQLTFHGLSELNHILLEGQFGVFFRNNHFSTIHKHKVAMLLL